MTHLPYTVHTDTQDTFDIEFPLSEHTEDSVRVHQLLTTVLNSIANDLKIVGTVSNGDILQALSMALAVRTRMVYAPEQTMRTIVADLTESALAASYAAKRESDPAGHG
jgi:hypothetical protein|tara:strand:+ start:1665 stop:1991 length:327 start_codon:yes stop_codon:yes gene_type:complete